jgi:hypothetical protein
MKCYKFDHDLMHSKPRQTKVCGNDSLIFFLEYSSSHKTKSVFLERLHHSLGACVKWEIPRNKRNRANIYEEILDTFNLHWNNKSNRKCGAYHCLSRKWMWVHILIFMLLWM